MNSDDWARLKSWFAKATEGGADSCAAVIAEAARESPELVAELRLLLEEHEKEVIHTGMAGSHVQAEEIALPEKAGPYRILRELGRGGSGIVFQAEREDDEYHRQVAVKLLRYVTWDPGSVDTLNRERRALSKLRHANIAGLVDWGTTPDGIPWLCVEYVDGLPIDAFCAGRNLGLAPTLDLFEQVCEAVAYAHRVFIVHGDLKPPNILVRGDGVVKLLDFGISRLLNAEANALTAQSHFTPAYASPEQLQGELIEVGTDVYSLGVQLYELLTGMPLYAGLNVETVIRQVTEERVPRPSESPGLARERRQALRGDLDAIVMCALEKNPNNRYPTAERLLADIRAYRLGYPVEARRAGTAYQLRKFLGRNLLSTGIAAVALLGLVSVAAVASAEAREAERQRRVAETRLSDVRNLAHAVIFDLHDQIRKLPGALEARRMLVKTAVQYLDGLQESGSADDSVQMELGAGYYRMGYAQGGILGTNLGDSDGGRQSFAKAQRILDEQWRKHYGDPKLGVLQNAVALCLTQSFNDPAEGLAYGLRYTSAADEWGRKQPGIPSWTAAYLLHQVVGRLYRNQGRLDKAIAELDLAREIALGRLLPLASPESATNYMAQPDAPAQGIIHQVAIIENSRAITLLDMGQTGDALAATQTVERYATLLLKQDPNDPPPFRVRYATFGIRSQSLLEMGRQREAAAEARREMDGARHFAELTGPSHQTVRDMTSAQLHLAEAVTSTDPSLAVQLLREAEPAIAKVAESDPHFLVNPLLHSSVLNRLGAALMRKGEPAAAARAFAQALEITGAARREAPGSIDVLFEKALAERGLARTGDVALRTACEADWAELARRSPLRHRPSDAGSCAMK